jgi:hypothetical protein
MEMWDYMFYMWFSGLAAHNLKPLRNCQIELVHIWTSCEIVYKRGRRDNYCLEAQKRGMQRTTISTQSDEYNVLNPPSEIT